MAKENFVDLNAVKTDYGTARIDPFYYDQPENEFVDELKKPFYQKRPENFNTRKKEDGEVCANGIYLDLADWKGEDLLETAFFEFDRFTKLYGIDGTSYPVILKKIDTDTYESHKIEIKEGSAVISAADTEGIRRGLYRLMDEICISESPYLEKKSFERKPWLKNRITRGFFSPTNRAPKFGDELFDEIDYYPDEYLNRLAHDGSNGIWIYTSFRALMTSSVFSEYGDGAEKRIEKLRKVVKKCARYGIKVFVFAIEPMHLVGDMAEKYGKLTGAFNAEFGQHAICLSTEEGRRYLSECVEKLFTLVPDLGGYIDITSGERITSCASFPNIFHTCKRCSKRPIGELLAEEANLIKAAIKRANSDAEFISWTYGHKMWQTNDILEYAEKCDTGVVLMQNFEEYSYAEQLGKMRQGKDYWLSCVGPGELFKSTAGKAMEKGKQMYAKMQVCCSHELASVPYIPTPGLIFEKLKEAKKYGTTGIMQCWYFGNYPSLMSKAAGELSFCTDFNDKVGFLEKLAATYYGKSAAKELAHAWMLFEEAYSNYPLNIMFSYYGPMHDSVVWQLSLLPKDNYLPRSWQLLDEPNGDRMHEALWQGHTLEEAYRLCDVMYEKWADGMKLLPISKNDGEYSVYEAISLLFKSGRNILLFYKLRRELGLKIGSPSLILSKMRSIVEDEINNSRAMIPLCEKDKRLGYHSEAEGFKFFPKKLNYRIEKLFELLDTEFKEVESRISKGLSPLEFYEGKKDGKYDGAAYFMNSGEERGFGEDRHSFSVECTDDEIILTVNAKSEECCVVCYEFEPLIPSPTLKLSSDGKIDFVSEVYTHHSMFADKFDKEKGKYTLSVSKTEDGYKYVLRASRALCEYGSDTPLRLRLSVGSDFVKESKINIRFLAKWDEYPDMFIWLIPSKNK